MAIRPVARDALNERLRVVAADSVAADYTASRAAVDPPLTELRNGGRFGGWLVRGWANARALQLNQAPLALWEDGTIFQVRRDYVLEITRSREHQDRAERNNEVRPGDNTYEQVFSELFQVEIGDRLDGDTRDTFVTAIEAVASAIDHVSQKGVRPPRLRDLS